MSSSRTQVVVYSESANCLIMCLDSESLESQLAMVMHVNGVGVGIGDILMVNVPVV